MDETQRFAVSHQVIGVGRWKPGWRPGHTELDRRRFRRRRPEHAHALSGAVFVKGARPGDTLEIDILKMEHKGWGWSGHIPHVELLADDFDSAHLHHWELEGSICRFRTESKSPPSHSPA